MKLAPLAAVLVLLVAAVWVWRHNTVDASKACVTAPARVCVERATTTRRRRA